MAVLYVYTDLSDNVKKYVGIVWSENRTLKQRVEEHDKEDWCQGKCWKIEYLQRDISSRTDAELLEAHYISKFKTNEWYNKSKANWGESNLIDDTDDEWLIYRTDEKPVSKWTTECFISKFEYNSNHWLSNTGEFTIRLFDSEENIYWLKTYVIIGNDKRFILAPDLICYLFGTFGGEEKFISDFGEKVYSEIPLYEFISKNYKGTMPAEFNVLR